MRHPLLPLAIALVATQFAFAQSPIPDSWNLIAHYPLTSTGNDTTGSYGPMTLTNTEFVDGALSLNGIYSGSTTPGGYIARTPSLDGLDLSALALSVEFNSDSLQFSPVLNGGRGFRWATFWVRTDTAIMLSLDNYDTVFNSTVQWVTDTWHEATIVVNNDSVSLWLDDSLGVHRAAVPVTGEDRTVTFDHGGLGSAFYGRVRNLKVYSIETTTSAESLNEVPASALEISVFPNPLSESSQIEIEGAASDVVQVTVVDVLGRTVARMDDTILKSGRARISLQGLALTRGLYFVRAASTQAVKTHPIVISH